MPLWSSLRRSTRPRPGARFHAVAIEAFAQRTEQRSDRGTLGVTRTMLWHLETACLGRLLLISSSLGSIPGAPTNKIKDLRLVGKQSGTRFSDVFSDSLDRCGTIERGDMIQRHVDPCDTHRLPARHGARAERARLRQPSHRRAGHLSIEDLMRLMEFGSRPDAICELRLMAFAAGVLVTRRKQLDRAPFALPGAIRPAILAAVSPTGEDGRSVAQHRF